MTIQKTEATHGPETKELFFVATASLLARYPSAVIHNPSGNIIADSASIAYHAPSCGTCVSPAVFNKYISGAAVIGTPTATATWTVDSFPPSIAGLIPDCMVEANGVTWVSDEEYNGIDYNDTLIARKGIWNASLKRYTYTTLKIGFPVNADNKGAKMFGTTNIAFSKDGQTGYLSCTAHDDFSFEADSAFYICVFKTTDGGITWVGPARINLQCVYQQLGASAGTIYNTAFQLDGAVDMNGKLHLILGIAPWASGGSINTIPGTWGEFSVITDGVASGSASIKLLDKPMSFRGTFGGITEDSRGQIAVSKAGDKVFYIWFDTDTNSYPFGGNTNPNAVCRFYDVASGNWGAVTNLTSGTAGDGVVTFGYVAYWAQGSASPYTIHIGYQFLTGTDTQPVDFHYLQGITVSTTSASIGNACSVIPLGTSETHSAENLFTIYPNPSNGFTTLAINMATGGKVLIEISNLVGQTIYHTGKELAAGTHTFSVDASKWNSGVYFYTVKTGNSSVTKKLVRE